MLEEKGLVGDGRSISCYDGSEADGFDGHAHSVELRKLLIPKSIVDEGLYKELITLTEKGFIRKVFMNTKRVLGIKLPEGFVSIIGNIGCK